MAKPLIKWAGGKTQLLDEIMSRLPDFIIHGQPYIYVEPFMGSGAVGLRLLDTENPPKMAIFNDVNADLMCLYRVVREHPRALAEKLRIIQQEYNLLTTQDDKKPYYYKKRELFNSRSLDGITQASLFIFLNRAGFNGLFRVNSKNEFNVPIGSYKRPNFVFDDQILHLSSKLKDAKLLCGDYRTTLNALEEMNTESLPVLFYLDPPYKPISDTSSFTSYAKGEFGDAQQIELAKFCQTLEARGYHWLLSNSDPKSVDKENDFFDKLYATFQIGRVRAGRSINSKASKRGQINELLIKNS